MRVISGSARGLKLKAPKGLKTRPTTDKIKESLFNIISEELYDCCFLDIFSGSGAIGLEALSRGAKEAVFVDNSYDSINVIKDNVSKARLSHKAKIIKADAVYAVNKLAAQGQRFDIIFMDPPYDKGFTEPVLRAVYNTGLLEKDGFIISEQASYEEDIHIDGLTAFRVKDYKTTKMVFFEYTEDI